MDNMRKAVLWIIDCLVWFLLGKTAQFLPKWCSWDGEIQKGILWLVVFIVAILLLIAANAEDETEDK